MERCLIEQMIGDIKYDGINNEEFWYNNVCLADVLVILGEEDA